MATHRVEVVPVTLTKHPNADTLSIVTVFGFSCCVRTKDFEGVTLGAYIEPDSLLDPERPEFAFLKDKAKAYQDGKVRARIKVAKLRGVISQGLLVVAKPHWKLGDDVMTELGVEHYNPPEPTMTGGDSEPGPKGYHPYYDVENWRRYPKILQPGEMVEVSEKIHGANGRFCFFDGRMYCGSHGQWKKDDPKSIWWRALRQYPVVETFCRAHPDITIYAEVYGQVQDLRYGTSPGEIRLGVFDLLRGNQWVPVDEARTLGVDLPWVPVVAHGAYHPETIEKLADGESLVPGAHHLREGIVIRPLVERTDLEIGRAILKVVSNEYLSRA